jgi:hypothetical protein
MALCVVVGVKEHSRIDGETLRLRVFLDVSEGRWCSVFVGV